MCKGCEMGFRLEAYPSEAAGGLEEGAVVHPVRPGFGVCEPLDDEAQEQGEQGPADGLSHPARPARS